MLIWSLDLTVLFFAPSIRSENKARNTQQTLVIRISAMQAKTENKRERERENRQAGDRKYERVGWQREKQKVI